VLDVIGLTGASHPALQFLGNLFGMGNLIFKTTVGVTVMMWVRWTLPRLRIDQVMTTCLKYCVPLAALCFLGALSWQVMGLPSGGDLLGLGTHRNPASVRESWVTRDLSVASPVRPVGKDGAP